MLSVPRLLVMLLASCALGFLVVACGGSGDSGGSGSSASAPSAAPAPSGSPAPSASPAPPVSSASPAAAPPASSGAKEASAEVQSCIDLVKAKKYAEAISPCERAIRDTASVDAKKAYEEAKTEVAKQAQDAALKAASDSLSGDAGAQAAAAKAAADSASGTSAEAAAKSAMGKLPGMQ